MSYKDFANDHKKGITGDTLFFYGAEDYLISWAKDMVINDNVPEESRDIDVIELDGESVSAYDIMSEARVYSMFSDRRVVIVNNYLPLYRKDSDMGTDELKEFVGSPLETSILVFILDASHSGDITSFGKKMIKACSSYEFARLEKADLKAFVNKRVHAGSKMIARRELEHLIDVTGYYNRDSAYDLAELDKDISKLVKACEGDEITSGLIEDILTGDSDRFVFNLVDALTLGGASALLCIDRHLAPQLHEFQVGKTPKELSLAHSGTVASLTHLACLERVADGGDGFVGLCNAEQQVVENLHLIPSGGFLLEAAVHGTRFILLTLERGEFVAVQFDDERERRTQRLPMAVHPIHQREGTGIVCHHIIVRHLIAVAVVVI